MTRRKLGTAVVLVAVFAVGLWSGIGSAGWADADADPIALKSALSAAKEVPKPKGVGANAAGTFAGGLARKGAAGTLTWRLTFRGLTGRAAAAHVHLGKAGEAGPVAVALCRPCRSGARGSVAVNARTVGALLRGGAYVNVHTAKNPAGEIRGQIAKGGKPPVVTDPTTTSETTTTTTPYPPYP